MQIHSGKIKLRHFALHLYFAGDFAVVPQKIKNVGSEKAESVIKELAESNESMLVHVAVDPNENVLPMVPAGKSLNEVITKL